MKFTIPDMTCGGCVQSITRLVTKLDPDASVSADLNSHVVTIESCKTEPEIRKVLEQAGFPAE